MFVEKTLNENRNLVATSIDFHQQGLIEPDSYVIDVDQFLENAKMILDEANKNEMILYFMLKQVGRNPYLAKELIKLGYQGAVVVDFKEAQVMMKHQIPLGNVGHLVQVPQAQLKRIIDYGCEVMTVYSIEKIRSIEQACAELHKHQDILIRVVGEDDLIYPGQTAGFKLNELNELIEEVKVMQYVRIAGVTSFPCFLYDEAVQETRPTNNLKSVKAAVEILKQHDIKVKQINTPSTTCVSTIHQMAMHGGTHGEPGHGLTGTTPAHAFTQLDEVPCILYLSEISHNYEHQAYCFGGGYYRRSHMKNALVATSMENIKHTEVFEPAMDNIDYHFTLKENFAVGESVIMAFRFQIFVTRSNVVLIEGLKSGKPKIVGVYDSLGGIK